MNGKRKAVSSLSDPDWNVTLGFSPDDSETKGLGWGVIMTSSGRAEACWPAPVCSSMQRMQPVVVYVFLFMLL